MKSRVKLGLARMSVPAKIEKGRQIVTAMTGNPSFASPVPALTAVTTAINNLDAAYVAAQNGGRIQRSHMQDMEEALDLTLTQLSLYVELTAAGNETKILSAGMDTKRPRSMPDPVDAPTGLKVENGLPGEVKLSWKKVRSAVTYKVEMALSPGSASRDSLNWEEVGYTTKTRIKVPGLLIATSYSFRVQAIGSDESGPWSDIATRQLV